MKCIKSFCAPWRQTWGVV